MLFAFRTFLVIVYANKDDFTCTFKHNLGVVIAHYL